MRITRLLSLCLLSLPAFGAQYATSFSGTENPISESSNWTNGAAVGLDWTNVRKTPGMCFGTQSGTANPATDDSIACLAGVWGSNQTVQATFHRAASDTAGHAEVELLTLWKISAHSAQGYECNFGTKPAGGNYTQVVRWNGALNSFTLLDSRSVPDIADGDTLKVTCTNSGVNTMKITSFINGTAIFSVTDSIYSNGTPGIGFYWDNPNGAMSDFGFSSYSATDGITNAAAAAGTTLTSTLLKAGTIR